MNDIVLYLVVPCYNEEEVLPVTIKRLAEMLDNLVSKSEVSKESRIVFVDDGSTDNTWNIIESAYSTYTGVRSIKLAANVGHQNALMAGLTEAHAEKYSQGYKAHKGYTFWEKDFDGMAYKTMLRQLISKWGIMSIEMRDVITKDDCILRENNAIELVADTNDNDAVEQQNEPTEAEKVTMDKL